MLTVRKNGGTIVHVIATTAGVALCGERAEPRTARRRWVQHNPSFIETAGYVRCNECFVRQRDGS